MQDDRDTRAHTYYKCNHCGWQIGYDSNDKEVRFERVGPSQKISPPSKPFPSHLQCPICLKNQPTDIPAHTCVARPVSVVAT